MLDTWRSLERTLRRYAPQKLRSLNGPALPADLRHLEDAIGVRLPRQFTTSYRLHDGQTIIGIEDALYEHEELLSLDHILREWRDWQRMNAEGAFIYRMPVAGRGIQPLWWHPHWLPLTSNGAGGYHCLDLAPAEGGRRGQIIHIDRRGAARMPVARSLKELLESWTEE